MKIGELARAASTKAETIRFYEKIGILKAPERTSSNYRDYGPHQLARLSFIRRARALGFGLDDIRELMDLSGDPSGSCDAIDEIAKRHLVEVRRKLKDLKSMESELNRVVGLCRHGTVSDCRIIGTLGPDTHGH